MKSKIKKAYEIKDAKISFVSLVDKAANKRQFLITKADDGNADWKTTGRIIKADNHYVTGIVYEPLVEDSQGDFMTADEIQKACYWFAKNGDAVDIQHNFEAHNGISVVENWVEKADTEIDGEKIVKGTWLVTAEISDSDIWNKITKGEITGFSMGGTGKYSEEDVDLESVTKENEDKQGLLSKLAKALGFKTVIKGKVAEICGDTSKRDIFWNAVYALEDCLYRFDWSENKAEFETDETKIRECLSDFNSIVTELLVNEKIITKAIAPDLKQLEKAGKKISGKNKETLSGIYSSLGEFLKEFDESGKEDSDDDSETTNENNDKEEKEVTKEDMKLLQEGIAEGIAKAFVNLAKSESIEKADNPITQFSPEMFSDMVNAAVKKAMKPEKPDAAPVSETERFMTKMQEMIDTAVEKAVEPIRKAAGIPTNLNDAQAVKKDSEHYLSGLL
ncbi:MAG: XkdF-like putative serine protease domain-containing protein [Clostridium sp.]|nr:XkdF-like putative serine protease domain-containing protein [Clostridium sp.]